jgi:hypothetical protein
MIQGMPMVRVWLHAKRRDVTKTEMPILQGIRIFAEQAVTYTTEKAAPRKMTSSMTGPSVTP